MKNIFKISMLSLVLLYSCEKVEKPLVSETEIKTEIETLMNNWHESAAKADYKPYMNAMDSSSIFIGTDASENWNKSEFEDFSKPYFNKGKAWSFTTLERNIFVSKDKNIAWFDELLNTQMGTCRGSGVLEKTNKEWKIKHYVLSISIPNPDVEAVIKVKAKKDSIFLKNRK